MPLLNKGGYRDKWVAEQPLPLTPNAASRPIGIPLILKFLRIPDLHRCAFALWDYRMPSPRMTTPN
jgi:hypothetical protein